MRDWDRRTEDIRAAGATLLVLTADEPDTLRRVVPKKGLKATFVPVEPELWARWGIANPRREAVPHPGTLVVAPDGTVVLFETHVNYREREDAGEVLARIAEHRTSGGLTAAPASDEQAVDWDSALRVSAEQRGEAVAITLDIAEGFHLYGTKEETARPLALRVDGEAGARVALPAGIRTELGDGLGQAWVLTGRHVIQLEGSAVAGELDVQLCTDTACSRPRTLRWSAGP